LVEALLSINTQEECVAFLDDLCTVVELQALSQRWEVVRLLDAGKTYAEIAEATSASTATISRINRCLSYGSARGYRTVLDGLKAKK
jgi:TrpR-related protein YerC/YecD